MDETPETTEAAATPAAEPAPTLPDAIAKAEAILQEAAAATKPALDAAPIERVCSDWVAMHIRGGPIARNVEAWNHLQAALPELKAALAKGD